MVFASPMPDETVLLEFNNSYFKSAHGSLPNKRDAVVWSFFTGIAKIRYEFLHQYLRKHRIEVNVLKEVGSGPGFFAENWLMNHPKTRYLVVESDSSCFDSLERLGIKIIKNNNEENSLLIDLVVMSHVLEHVSDPQTFMTDMTKNLKKGSVIFIEVPCRDYEHKSIDEPHLLFFDKEPMKIFLNNLGFEKIEVSYHGKIIKSVKRESWLYHKFMALRSKLLTFGVISPFDRFQNDIDFISNPLERTIVGPFLAHKEQQEPSWWLRALAVKK